ncbi:hypothetical protein [Rubrivirga marina]|uniref:Uncharacterized protein n=1 Tax=Rubrivirga marina TaxID=1196024 RepID=A0A271J6R4_9BACT|nr:hypothetical protein [Rubrivirga marina]PAP78339.1 hypothetical protein BSZ37_18890 [Rubrivirga marina]
MKGFTEDEARQIFARAAERQHAVEARGEELSLEELQAIGAEAGLDPAHVAAAVAELRDGPPTEPVVAAGVDLTPRVVRVVPGELTDDVWAQAIARFRRTFGAQGIPTEIGRVREWTSGEQSNLRVVAEPAEGGTRLTFSTSKAHDAGGLRGLVPISAGFALLLSLLFGFGDFEPMVWVIPVLTLGMGAAIYFSVRASLKRWSDRRQREFEGLADQVDLLVRSETGEADRLGASGGTGRGTAVPRLGLDGLAEAGDDAEPLGSLRTRTRS